MPRARRSRSIFANQSSTWLSQDGYVGVKCRCTFGWSSRNVRTACVLWIEVVGDHVNYSPRRLRLHDVAEDLDKRGAGLRGLVVAEHLPEACPMPPGASACHGG